MSTKKHLTIISPNCVASEVDKAIIRQLKNEQDVEVLCIRTIPEVYTLLSDPKFQTRAIAIDMQSLYNQEDVQLWELVNTVATLIKSTVFREEPTSKPKKRETIIVVGITANVDPILIKEFLSTNDEIRGVFPCGPGFTTNEKLDAVNAFMQGKCYIPKKIVDLLKPKKQREARDGITLTPRQEQVLTLIQERGASNKVIARILKISESTVKLHVGQVLKKFGVKNRTQLALFSKAK